MTTSRATGLAAHPICSSSRLALVSAVAGLLAITLVNAQDASPAAGLLWRVVHSLCVPDERNFGNPAPCALVDIEAGEERGFAVVKSPQQATEVLVVPTARIVGIEDPSILTAGAPNYWEDAWQQRGFVATSLGRGLKRDEVALAVNSAIARSQDQLHIHVDCVRHQVRNSLAANEPRIGNDWSELKLGPSLLTYSVRKIVAEDLDKANPFQMVASEIPGAHATMAKHALVVVGAIFGNGQHGFYLLDHQANMLLDDIASGEDLLDHSCSVR